MNATIIISVALAMLSVTSSAIASDTQYAHNTETASGRVTTQTVYKVEADKYLHCHVKNNFSYNAQNLLQQKEVLKWNTAISGWEKSYCINVSYDRSETTITYARWDSKKNAYSEVLEKAIYNQDKETSLLASYQSFKWNKQSQQWELVTEHATIGWIVVIESSSSPQEVRNAVQSIMSNAGKNGLQSSENSSSILSNSNVRCMILNDGGMAKINPDNPLGSIIEYMNKSVTIDDFGGPISFTASHLKDNKMFNNIFSIQ